MGAFSICSGKPECPLIRTPYSYPECPLIRTSATLGGITDAFAIMREWNAGANVPSR
jgi:hypothetical protein